MAELVEVAREGELASGERKSIIVDDVLALLVRWNDAYYVVEDVCSHDGQPLTDGAVADGQIECPRHGARFELSTGRPRCMPATEPIRSFPVHLRDGRIFVEV